jgi:hypothetical protein
MWPFAGARLWRVNNNQVIIAEPGHYRQALFVYSCTYMIICISIKRLFYILQVVFLCHKNLLALTA